MAAFPTRSPTPRPVACRRSAPASQAAIRVDHAEAPVVVAVPIKLDIGGEAIDKSPGPSDKITRAHRVGVTDGVAEHKPVHTEVDRVGKESLEILGR